MYKMTYKALQCSLHPSFNPNSIRSAFVAFALESSPRVTCKLVGRVGSLFHARFASRRDQPTSVYQGKVASEPTRCCQLERSVMDDTDLYLCQMGWDGAYCDISDVISPTAWSSSGRSWLILWGAAEEMVSSTFYVTFVHGKEYCQVWTRARWVDRHCWCHMPYPTAPYEAFDSSQVNCMRLQMHETLCSAEGTAASHSRNGIVPFCTFLTASCSVGK